MNTFSVGVLLLIVAFSNAQDDGKYRPQVYGGDDGKYRPSAEGLYQPVYNGYYNNLLASNSKYNTQYRPVYYQAPNRNLISPFIKYGGEVNPYASTLAPVTYRPPVVAPTYRPLVYSTPRPVVYANGEAAAGIVRLDNDINLNSYRYAYETTNGIAAEEAGAIEPTVNGAGTRARGFFQYLGNDGITYRVEYTADENGFRPVGAHLPKLGAK